MRDVDGTSLDQLEARAAALDENAQQLNLMIAAVVVIVAGILLLWLVGIVCGWRWTYSRPGSWEGNFWLYITGSFASFFIIAEQKNHSKEQPLIERLQEIRDGKYPVEKTHSPTGE